MKKWYMMLIVLIVIMVVGQMLQKQRNELKIEWGDTSTEHPLASDRTVSIVIEPEQIHQGKLLLINVNHRLEKAGIAADIDKMSVADAVHFGYTLDDPDMLLSKEVQLELQQMLAAAIKEGLMDFLLTSGYRNLEKQALLYEQQGSDLALPAGYSEHNSGLAIDISTRTTKMESAPEGKWLQQHSAKYGFILRYPPNKQHITGIQYEPWHFRFVGLPHSIIMKEHDWVLEEYLEHLETNPVLNVQIGTKKYTVQYYNYEPGLTVELPSDVNYYISGTNADGIIVTQWRE